MTSNVNTSTRKPVYIMGVEPIPGVKSLLLIRLNCPGHPGGHVHYRERKYGTPKGEYMVCPLCRDETQVSA